MRVGLASSISIAGVLLAGGAAFALNSNVLDVSKESQQSPAIFGNGQVTTTPIQAAVSVPTSPITSAPPIRSAVNVPISPISTTYRVGTAGSVVMQIVSGRLNFTSVLPAAGWTAERTEYDESGEVEVYFSSPTSRLEFSAWLLDGEIKTRITSDHLPTQTAAPLQPAKVSHDDDNEEDHKNHEKHDEDSDEDDD